LLLLHILFLHVGQAYCQRGSTPLLYNSTVIKLDADGFCRRLSDDTRTSLACTQFGFLGSQVVIVKEATASQNYNCDKVEEFAFFLVWGESERKRETG